MNALLGCTEAAWQMTVVSAAAHLGWTSYHTFDSRRSNIGYPDLTLVHPVHGVVWMELKSEKGRVSEAQERWIALLQEAGEQAGVYRPSDWGAVELLLKGEQDEPIPAEGSMDYFAVELRRLKADVPELTMDAFHEVFWAAYEMIRESKEDDGEK